MSDFKKPGSCMAYFQEVAPLLSGPPQIMGLTPVWSKVGA